MNIWSEKKRLKKLNDMHHNPVKRGLVAQPGDWPWSSWRFYYLEDIHSGDGQDAVSACGGAYIKANVCATREPQLNSIAAMAFSQSNKRLLHFAWPGDA